MLEKHGPFSLPIGEATRLGVTFDGCERTDYSRKVTRGDQQKGENQNLLVGSDLEKMEKKETTPAACMVRGQTRPAVPALNLVTQTSHDMRDDEA